MHTTEPVIVRLVQLAAPDDLAQRSTAAVHELFLGYLHPSVWGDVGQGPHIEGDAGIVLEFLRGWERG